MRLPRAFAFPFMLVAMPLPAPALRCSLVVLMGLALGACSTAQPPTDVDFHMALVKRADAFRNLDQRGVALATLSSQHLVGTCRPVAHATLTFDCRTALYGTVRPVRLRWRNGGWEVVDPVLDERFSKTLQRLDRSG